MTDIEDKIRNLLARASHPNTPEEEARSCAVIAAKLMREHNIEVGSVGSPPDPVAARSEVVYATGLQLLFRLAQSILDQAAQRRAQPPPPPPSPPVDAYVPFGPTFWDEWDKQIRRRQKKRNKRRKRNRQRRSRP